MRQCSLHIEFILLPLWQITMKLSKLIFMVRFIKLLEQIWPIEEGAILRLVPMKVDKDARKINKDCHKVYTSLDSLTNVN